MVQIFNFIIVPELQRQMATAMAQAMYQAWQSKADAKIQIGSGELIGMHSFLW